MKDRNPNFLSLFINMYIYNRNILLYLGHSLQSHQKLKYQLSPQQKDSENLQPEDAEGK